MVLIAVMAQFSGKARAQVTAAYSPVVDSLIELVTDSTVSILVRQLSGDTTVVVGGEAKTITTRNYQFNAIQDIAAQFVYEKFLQFGYQARYQNYSSTGRNVLGWKTGTKYPDKKYIICAHYDNMPTASLAPGADDNASGVVAVLEAARLLSGFNSDYTIEFAVWDEEEIGLVGSAAYADSANANGDIIMGVLNYDMIAWDSNNDYKLTLGTNALSQGLTNNYQDVMNIYTPELNWNYTSIEASDHASFWNYNIPALLAIEEYPGDFNAYYHTPQDAFNILNIAYFKRMVQAAVAGLATEGWNCKMGLQHTPIVSGVNTDDQTAILNAVSPLTIANNVNKPRMYYSINGGDFQFVNANLVTGSSYKFMIPGQPYGTTVNYYFAVQDQNGLIIETLPKGGKGVNPPGTLAPVSFYSYLVAPDFTQTLCSVTVPKNIPDLSTVYDTIHVDMTGGVKDINVNVNINHTRVSTLNLSLISPDGTVIDLSSGNGGSGSNFTNTTFDDEAMISIKSGSAPYTGSYKPEQPLSNFDLKSITGDWILKVEDFMVSQNGSLQSWCLTMNYYDLAVSVADREMHKKFILGQNFPNPVIGKTSIPITLANQAHVQIDLFDLYGRKVSTIVSGYFQSGLSVVEADVAGLPGATYFYRSQVGNETETKIMLISR